jgi:hypothetical protein
MSLYDLVKDRIQNVESIVSDNEILALNRRDFTYSETSATKSFLRMFNAEGVSHEMYSIIDYVHSVVCKVSSTTGVRVYQLSQSMTLPSLAVSVFLGNKPKHLQILAPRGYQRLAPCDPHANEYLERFEKQSKAKILLTDVGKGKDEIDIIFANASSEAEVASGIKAFERVKRGVLIIKGYARSKAPNCGELIVSANLNVHCTIAGFGVCTSV